VNAVVSWSDLGEVRRGRYEGENKGEGGGARVGRGSCGLGLDL
jgi:hypothetical protein